MSDLSKRIKGLLRDASTLLPPTLLPPTLLPPTLLPPAWVLPPALRSSAAKKIAVAAVLVALLAAWNIHTDWGIAGGSAVRAERKLQATAEQRLLGVGATWARLSMDGQAARIEGVAPSDLDLSAARGTVRNAAWTGGVLLGGVTRVRSDAAQVWAAREGAYPWAAELDRNRVTLRGSVPTRETARELGLLAGALFTDRRVVNELGVDPVPPGEGWPDAARGALAILSHLETGEASLADFELTVTGEAATEADAESARAGLTRLDDMVSALSRVDVRAPRPAPIAAPAPARAAAPAVAPAPVQTQSPDQTPDPAPDVAAAPADPPPSPPQTVVAALAAPVEEPAAPQETPPPPDTGAGCQARLDEALTENEIRFDTDSAALSAESRPLLARLAEIAAACPAVALRVEGYTDNTGAPETNQALSERRALAVVERLSELGVASDRLSASGLGAARPAADNSTAEGRRANRRIEIIAERQEQP